MNLATKKMNIIVDDCNVLITPLSRYPRTVGNCLKEHHITKGIQNAAKFVDWFDNRYYRYLETWTTVKDEIISCASEKQKPCTNSFWTWSHCSGETHIYEDQINRYANEVNSILSKPVL